MVFSIKQVRHFEVTAVLIKSLPKTPNKTFSQTTVLCDVLNLERWFCFWSSQVKDDVGARMAMCASYSLFGFCLLSYTSVHKVNGNPSLWPSRLTLLKNLFFLFWHMTTRNLLQLRLQVVFLTLSCLTRIVIIIYINIYILLYFSVIKMLLSTVHVPFILKRTEKSGPSTHVYCSEQQDNKKQ